MYQQVYNRRGNLRFFGVLESTDGGKNMPEVVCKFLSDELELENAKNIEFHRAHRIGKKKIPKTRPVIIRFLRFPEHELVFKRVPELADDIDLNVYADYPKLISKRRKQWPHLKEPWEEGQIAFSSKPEPDRLFTNGQFVRL